MCDKFRENQIQTVAGVAIWNSLMTSRQTDISHPYYKLGWLQAAGQLKTQTYTETHAEMGRHRQAWLQNIARRTTAARSAQLPASKAAERLPRV